MSVRLFGLELLSIEASTDDDVNDEPERDLSGGTTAATPMGFTPQHGDQRWEQGVEQ